MQLSRKERRMLRREEKQRELERVLSGAKKKNLLKLAVCAFIVLAIGYGGYRFIFTSPKGEDPKASVLGSCITHSGGMHIHPHVTIRINEEQQEIPKDIGVSVRCMRPVHTHDAAGTIHVEFPRAHDFTLGDFFKVWGKEFSSTQIFDFRVDENHLLSINVNGEPNSEYENLILKDGAKIEITYGAR